jgi:hypothetical protein
MNAGEIRATDIRAHLDAVPPDPRKPGDPGAAAKDITLEKGTILGLEVTGIDLVKDIRNMTGKVTVKGSIDIEKLRIAVGDAGKDQIVTTVSLKAHGKESKDAGLRGRDLSATLFGPAGKQCCSWHHPGDPRRLEGLGAKTGFSTGRITMSPVEINGRALRPRSADVEIQE